MKADRKIAAALAGATLLVGLMVGISVQAFRQTEEAASARQQTLVVINRANDLLSAVTDAETGQRGFALTGNEAFLEPYLAVRDGISGQLEELRRLASVSAAGRNLDALAPLVDAKLAELAQVIELRRNGDTAGVLAVTGSGQGKRLMDSIRAEMHGFMQIEDDALAQRDAGSRRTCAFCLPSSLPPVCLPCCSPLLSST